MGPVPADATTRLTIGSSIDAASLSIPKLRDDGSNWSEYQPRVERALGAKGLWKYAVWTAIAPKPFAMLDGVPVLMNGKMHATDEQVESLEDELDEFDRKEYLTQLVF